MTVTQQVTNILKASHAARNSDVELLLIYMQKSGMELTPKQVQIFRDMPSVETLRRTRQKIQMEGKFPADPEVDEARFKKYQNVKYGINHEDPERLLESQGYIIREWGD